MKSFNLVISIILINFLLFSVCKRVPFRGDKVAEMCVACKFIWENINEALEDPSDNFLYDSKLKSSRSNPILISQSFQYFCQISPNIFYESCNLMFEKLFFLTEDYISGLSVKEICTRNDFC